MDPTDVRWVLKLAFEVAESPELYDFLLGSGVVRCEEGVEVLRGIIEGDRELGRGSLDGGSVLATDDKL